MIHLAFFANLFALCTGAVSLTISLFFYLQYRKKVVIWYTCLLGMTILLLLSRMVELYSNIIGAEESIAPRIVALAIEQIGYLIGLVAGPRFCLQLIGVPTGRKITLGINAAALVYFLIASGELFLLNHAWSTTLRIGIGMPLLFGMFIILCIIAALKLESIASLQLRNTVKLFFVVALLVLPLSLIKYLRDLPYLPWHLENSLALLVITVASIFFALRFFNQPTFISKGSISDHFRTRFSTTAREEEIIQLAVKGLTNSDIADKLFISVRTVESHLYNVFQKTGVKNRIQLINLLATNSSD